MFEKKVRRYVLLYKSRTQPRAIRVSSTFQIGHNALIMARDGPEKRYIPNTLYLSPLTSFLGFGTGGGRVVLVNLSWA